MEKLISVVVDGQLVTGSITYLSHSGLTIEITTPFSGYYNAGPSVPTFARSKRSYLKDDSQSVAVELLSDLYKDLSVLEERQALLRPAVCGSSGLLSKLAHYKNDRARLAGERRLLKQQFRANVLAQKEYQQSLKLIRKRDEQISTSTAGLVASLIKEYLPGWHYSLDHSQLIKFLSAAFAASNNTPR